MVHVVVVLHLPVGALGYASMSSRHSARQPPLHLVELCNKAHPDALIKCAAHKQALLIGAPAECIDGLC